MTKEALRSLAKIALALALVMTLTGVAPAAPSSHKPPSDVNRPPSDVQPPPAGTQTAFAITPEVTGSHPWAIVLCNFSNQVETPHTVSYYEHMFSDAGAGELGLLDYWRDVSYTGLSVSGSVVRGWYTLGMTRDQWGALDRYNKIRTCADAAAGDINYAGFWGVAAVFPEAQTTTSGSINSSVTSVTVASTSLFPTPPFLVAIDDGSLPNGGNTEIVNVTGVSGTTYTIVRAQGGTTAKSHNSGAVFIVPGDFGDTGPGLVAITLGGNNFNLGLNVYPHQVNVTGAAHEMGHGFGYNHSRKLSDPTNDYNDCYDIMSAYSCNYTFNNAGTAFGGSLLGSQSAAKGPGFDAINLDIGGWMPAPRILNFSNGSCNQTTIRLHSLGDTGALGGVGYMEARIPASLSFGSTTSDYYTAEYREAQGWDRAFPDDSVLLHLHGTDGYSYWVNGAGHSGAMYPGDEYVDAAHNTFVAVHSTDLATHTALVTLAACKINLDLDYAGDTTGDFTDQVTLSADLSVAPHAAPVPSVSLSFTLGTQSCSGFTNASGHASCNLTLNQNPGVYTVNVSYAGDAAYNAQSASHSFTITQEDTQLVYTGDLTADFHDPAAASAVLTDPDSGTPIPGKLITFTLGGIDTCSATTNGSGIAACSLIPTQPASTVNMVAAFAGDIDFLPSSDTDPFVITKEETTTTYTGPTVILQGQSVTLSGQLLEDGIVPIAGRTLTLSLGAQSCTGVTDAGGNASCSFVVNVMQGPQPLKAEFAGDPFYLPSSDTSKQAIVFAFPAKGAFLLGEKTVDAASPATKVTWWGAQWAKQNRLSGGSASNSFKGFSENPSSNPPACGGTWLTTPGNSPHPPGKVPSYMGVLVTDKVKKSGSELSGNIVKIVVVKTDPRYSSNPGHSGTGKIVATYCP